MNINNIDINLCQTNLKVTEALHSTCPKELDELSKHSSPRIRRIVANNTSTSPKTLADLAKDKAWKVRANVALNTSTSPKTLAKLSNDKDWHVRCHVAANHSASQRILKELFKEDKCHKALAKNPNTPDEIVIKFSKSEYFEVRWEVSRRSSLPATTIENLLYSDQFICANHNGFGKYSTWTQYTNQLATGSVVLLAKKKKTRPLK